MIQDRDILRPLVEAYAALAADPINAVRRDLWRRTNDLERGLKPMIWINEEPWQELEAADPDALRLRCRHPYLRQVETLLRQTLYRWRHFQADMIVDPYLCVQCVTNFDDQCGMRIAEQTLGRTDGSVVSHEYVTQFASLDDLEKIKFIDLVYDRAATVERLQLLNDCCGDLIEVKQTGYGFISFTPWDKIAMWYNPMELLMDLMLKPELMHGLVDRYTNAMLYQLDQLEALRLLAVTHDNQRIGSGGLGFVSDLPGPDFDPEHVTSRNQWGNAMPQIFSDISPEMHEEFALQYDRKWLERFGLSYYGCCEPLHRKLDILKSVKNLRKISVSPWADQEKMATDIDGRYVLSIKPNPAILAPADFNPAELRNSLRRSLDIVRGLPCEFIFKDISTCRGDVRRISCWVQTLEELIQE